MRLIDLDYALEDFDRYGQYAADYTDRWLEGLPTVDAVPVIRCKDCVHKSEYGYCTLYLNFHHLTENMDYCSHAERKE